MKHLLRIILALCVALAGVTTAQEYIQLTDAQKVALRISQTRTELLRHNVAQLGNMLQAIAANPATAQANLDAMGTQAARALSDFLKLRAVLIEIDPAMAAPLSAIDVSVFDANPDGTVTFVPTPAPEIPDPEVPAE